MTLPARSQLGTHLIGPLYVGDPEGGDSTGVITSGTFVFNNALTAGGLSLISYTGDSVVVGPGAGSATMSGIGQNTIMGAFAGNVMTTGYQNSLFGWAAGNTLTDGYGNTFIGRAAGLNLLHGFYNIAVGISAGSALTGGAYQNVIMGAFAGSATTDASNNTFIGDSAGRLNTTGISNTMIGRAAGDANTTGNYAVFAGHQAGFRNTTGSFNTFLGDVCFQWNTTGSNNVGVGEYAGSTTVDANGNTTGSQLTCLGYNTGATAATQFSLSTAVGANAQYGASSVLILGGSGVTNAVNVGIGLSAPLQRLDVVGQTLKLGSDAAAEYSRTDATNKTCRVWMPHYTNAEQDVFVIGATSFLTGNTIQIGGSSAGANAASAIEFYTALDGITTTGTLQWSISLDGHLISQTATNDITGVRTISAIGSIVSNSATDGIGYTTGAGGAQTQATDKTTAVTLNRVCGEITTANTQLNAGTIVSFTLNNTALAAGDNMFLSHVSGGTPGAYTLNARPGANAATIDIRNNTGGNLSEALVIRFTVINGVTA